MKNKRSYFRKLSHENAKKKALVFGTGENMFRAYKRLTSCYEVLGFVDNNPDKQGNKIDNLPIMPIRDVLSFVFDYIIVTPSNHQSICRQLVELGVKRDSILLLQDVIDCPKYKSTISVALCLSGNLTDYLIYANYIWYMAHSVMLEYADIDVYCASGKQYADFVFDNSNLVQYVYDYPLQQIEMRDYDLAIELNPYPVILHRDDYVLTRIIPKAIDYILSCERFRILYGQVLGKNLFTKNRLKVFQEISERTWLQAPDINGFLNISSKYLYPLPLRELVPYIVTGASPFISLCSMVTGTVLDWPREYWSSLKSCLRNRFENQWIVDIVEANDNEYMTEWEMDGTIIERKLNFYEMAHLMRTSKLVIGTDQPLIYLRYALHGGTSIVLFGPTSEKTGGCQGNVNLRGIGCKHWCEGVTGNWYKECLLGEKQPPCMSSITAEWIMDEIRYSLGDGVGDLCEGDNG
ncbi:MAG: hypothetical protein J6O04_08705 [Selenomonadaceae bacterium]|nr:hypothetical protein [Selenomonadaceae bacterium]